MSLSYQITPFNVVAFLAIVFAIYSYRPNIQGDGYVNFGVFVLIIVSVIVLLGDFLFQRFTDNYALLVKVEAVIVFLLFLIPTLSSRMKTLVLPQGFSNQYVVTIYGVEGAPQFCSKWTRSYKKQVPPNGILLTSTLFENDISNTNIKYHSGENLNTNESMTRWLPFDENTLDCNGKTYRYQSWKIDNPTEVYKRTEEAIKALKESLEKQCKVVLEIERKL